LEWQASFGGGLIIEPDGTVSVDNPQAAKAIGMAARWVGSISPPSVLSYMEGDSLNVFRSGNAAFMRYWSSGSHSLRARASKIAGSFGVAPLPAGPKRRAQIIGGFQLAVSRYSAYPREAAELIQYLASEKAQKARALQDGYLPALSRLYHDPEILRSVPEAQVVETGGRKSWVLRPSSIAAEKYSAVSKDYYEAVHRILTGDCPPQEGLHDLEKQLINLKFNPGSGIR
jgi:trehalose/maltose transport system substrate-binding protein